MEEGSDAGHPKHKYPLTLLNSDGITQLPLAMRLSRSFLLVEEDSPCCNLKLTRPHIKKW